MNKKIAILGTLLLASNAVVAAQDNPFYAGARIGATYYNQLEIDGDNSAELKDNENFGGGIFLGYNINDWFGLETGYTYLGEAELADNAGVQTHAIDFVGKFTGEVTESLDIFAKAGAYAYKTNGQDSLDEYSESDVDLTFGFGLEQHFTDNLSVRLEYQFYNDVTLDDKDVDAEWDTHLLALGLIYSWGGQEPVAVTEAPITEVVEEVVVEEVVVEEVIVAPIVKKAIEVEPVTVEVYFDFNKQDLTIKSTKDLQPIIAHLKEYPEAKVILVGHADSVGASKINQKLSEERANTVSEYLQRVYSISSDRIVTSGEGEADPIATNETKEGRAQNRRVSVFSPSFTMKEM